jgi:hypothetical protein
MRSKQRFLNGVCGGKIDYLQCFLGAENNDFVGVLQCARDRKQRGVGARQDYFGSPVLTSREAAQAMPRTRVVRKTLSLNVSFEWP